jgi:glutathione peroxidase
MKFVSVLLSVALILASCGFKKVGSRPENMEIQATKSIYDFEMTAIDGEKISLGDYKGKKMLIVNTASECGYTPQYADLQKLHELYGGKVAILGFPANNFGGQEPGSNEEIASFCKENYDVSFQMFAKISVKGDDMAELYHWLSDKELNGWNEDAPGWNFCKYLIDENGELVKFYASAINPMSDELLAAINQ